MERKQNKKLAGPEVVILELWHSGYVLYMKTLYIHILYMM